MNSAILAFVLGSLAAPLGGAGTSVFAAGATDPVTPASRVWITGSSNVSRFSCEAAGVTGTVDLRANPTRGSVLSGQNVSDAPSLRIPVSRLDCGPEARNREMRRALRAGAYDAIEFHLDSYDVYPAGSGHTVRVAGRLRIAGVERAVVVTATAEADTLGRLHVRGTSPVRMTEHGVEPPRRFAGLLRVRDEVVVHFDIVPDCGGGAIDLVERTSHDTVGGNHVPRL
jgi:polyisoprenoid-binding protein YceI